MSLRLGGGSRSGEFIELSVLRSPGTAPRRKGRPMGPATPLVPYNQVVFGFLSGYLIAIGKFAGFLFGKFLVGKGDDSSESVAL